jgi:hypothetical protein
MNRPKWGAAAKSVTWGLALLCAGCGAPRVERSAEIERFRQEAQTRLAGLNLEPTRPVTLAECEAIAVQNNLEYRTRLLATQLQDDQVRLAMTGWLPRAEVGYMAKKRSNEPCTYITR